MVQEDYVSFEVAKLLKEKGFDEECRGFFHTAFESPRLSMWNKDHKNSDYEECVSAPTYQMAMKWLREVHKLAFIISPQWAEGDMRNPCRWYWEIRGLKDIGLDVYSNPLCNTYEEAVEAALKYSHENLL